MPKCKLTNFFFTRIPSDFLRIDTWKTMKWKKIFICSEYLRYYKSKKIYFGTQFCFPRKMFFSCMCICISIREWELYKITYWGLTVLTYKNKFHIVQPIFMPLFLPWLSGKWGQNLKVSSGLTILTLLISIFASFSSGFWLFQLKEFKGKT